MLNLVPFTSEHITPEYLSWLNDPALMRYSEQRHVFHDYDRCLRYASEKAYMWAVMRCEEPDIFEMVGTVAGDLDDNDVVDLGILIGRPGKGHGFAAWTLALEKLNDHRQIRAGAMQCNRAMVAIMTRTMTFSHRIQGRFLYDGRPMAGVYYVR